MTWISSTVLICMHIFIYVTSHVYIRCLDIWMFQRKWWVTHTPGISLYMVPLNSCVFEDQPLTATRPSSQGWGRTGGEPSHSCWSWQFLLLVISVLLIHSISWVDQPNLKPKRFFDDMTNSFFPAETVQHHLCESQKHIRKLETPACWVVIAVTVFASWTHAARSFTPWSSSPHRLHRLHRPHRHRPRRPWLSRWWRRRRQGRAAQRHHPLGGADPT